MSTCEHLDQITAAAPRTAGCEECLRAGTSWVHLRLCLVCGHVGCCDSSAGRHATRHFQDTGHPVMRSLEPDESWGWCYADAMLLDEDEIMPKIRRAPPAGRAAETAPEPPRA